MGLQLVHRKRLAFEVGDQRFSWPAVKAELFPPLQIAPQDGGRPACDRRTAGPADHDRVVLDRDFAEPQSADRLWQAAGAAEFSQELLLAAEKSFAQECQPERLEAPGGLAGKSLGKGPPVIDRGLDLSGGTMVAEANGHFADAVHAQQRMPHILGHQIGEIDSAPARRQPQRNLGVAGTQPQRAYKAEVEDRLIQLGIEHLRQPLENRRAVIAGRKVARDRIAHGLRPLLSATGCAGSASSARPSGEAGRTCGRANPRLASAGLGTIYKRFAKLSISE